MIYKLKSKLDVHTLEVIVKSSKSMMVKVLGMISALFVSIYLARTLGAEGLGIINLANKFGMILIIITMFGFQNVIIKFVSIAKEKGEFKEVANTLKTSLIFNSLMSVGIAALGVLFLPIIVSFLFDNQELYVPLLVAFLMIIPQTISGVYSAALIGYGKIWQANLMNETLSSILVGIGLILFWIFKIPFTVISVIALYAISRIIVVVFVKVLWNNTFESNYKGKITLKPMIKMGMPMLLVTGTTVIASNADVIMLGSLGTLKDVGLYSVAARLALLTSFLLQVTNGAIAPKLASLFNSNKIEEMASMVQKTTKGLLFVAILFLLLFYGLGNFMLSLWGVEFQEAYWILMILATGQFFNIATGCSGLLLVMCGHEKTHGYISAISVILNILLNIFLIKLYGALGAAIATAITVLLENIAKVFYARIKVGVLTLPFFYND